MRKSGITLAWAVIFLCIAGFCYILTVVAHRQQVILDTINTNSKTRSSQIQKLSDRMDCFFLFQAQTNRTELRIADIDNCVIVTTSTGQRITSFPPAQQEGTPRNSSTPTQTTTPAQPTPIQTPQQPREGGNSVIKKLIQKPIDVVKGAL